MVLRENKNNAYSKFGKTNKKIMVFSASADSLLCGPIFITRANSQMDYMGINMTLTYTVKDIFALNSLSTEYCVFQPINEQCLLLRQMHKFNRKKKHEGNSKKVLWDKHRLNDWLKIFLLALKIKFSGFINTWKYSPIILELSTLHEQKSMTQKSRSTMECCPLVGRLLLDFCANEKTWRYCVPCTIITLH